MSAALVLFPAVLPRVWATASVERPLPPVTELEPFGAEPKDFSPGSLAVAARRIGPARVVAMPPAAKPMHEPLRTLEPELAFYRKYTEGMLRRYMKLSMESGRVPSLLGRELFRGHVTSYKVNSFEDVVIFVHDVGNCLRKLDPTQQELIKRIALQEYTQGETAGRMGLSLKTVQRKYAEALDELTGIFLKRKMLEPLKTCQGA
ncbi:Sigma-70, region 4 [Granulicella rosea]|uniref:Sigma-70, region 4 n=1 Tax=Granulicella rosea TaxID=474952 RepID=A0A239DKT6_9BACT|nr:sigma factor-like helix-turn-helix DNA-binding protein [Granulicella rosea]SNS33070.1 Sigma-70, region 4 [Granulicella rosea]